MRALIQHRYGNEQDLTIEEVAVPAPGPGEIRVRVEACGANASDWEFVTGQPAYARAVAGLLRPKRRPLGSDVAGCHSPAQSRSRASATACVPRCECSSTERGGGSGSLVLQMAKAAGAEVWAVDSAAKLDLLRRLGADRVIDYREEDFAALAQRFDLVLDLFGKRSARRVRRVLAPGGRYLIVGGPVPVLLSVVIAGAINMRAPLTEVP